jgi:medium-chain acyl-[acyl-carrier-protein] hydrolase
VRLYCLPCAGGSTSLFQQWTRSAPRPLDIVPVVLPGRGSRFSERPLHSAPALVAALAASLEPRPRPPFAFFGHSMGALIAFELTRALRAHGSPLPTALFVSACAAPARFDVEPKIHALPDREFLDRLRTLRGTPPEVLGNREIMELLLPALRADFAVCETYQYTPGEPLECPIVTFGGEDDAEVTRELLEAWRHESRAGFSSHVLPGGHFYLWQEWPAVLSVVAKVVRSPARRTKVR